MFVFSSNHSVSAASQWNMCTQWHGGIMEFAALLKAVVTMTLKWPAKTHSEMHPWGHAKNLWQELIWLYWLWWQNSFFSGSTPCTEDMLKRGQFSNSAHLSVFGSACVTQMNPCNINAHKITPKTKCVHCCYPVLLRWWTGTILWDQCHWAVRTVDCFSSRVQAQDSTVQWLVEQCSTPCTEQSLVTVSQTHNKIIPMQKPPFPITSC